MKFLTSTPFTVAAAHAMTKKVASVFPGESLETIEQLEELIANCGWAWDLYSNLGYEIVVQENLRTELDADGNETRVVEEIAAVSFTRWPLVTMALQQAFGQALNKRGIQ